MVQSEGDNIRRDPEDAFGWRTSHPAHQQETAARSGRRQKEGGCQSSAEDLRPEIYSISGSYGTGICHRPTSRWNDVSGEARLVSYVINTADAPPSRRAAGVIALVELRKGFTDADANSEQTGGGPAELPLDAPARVSVRAAGANKCGVPPGQRTR